MNVIHENVRRAALYPELPMNVQIQNTLHTNPFARLLKPPLDIVRRHRRTYYILNAVYYGLIVLAMLYVPFNPALQQSLMQAIGTTFSQGPLSVLTNAYLDGQMILAILLTFVVNLFIGSFATITLPSLIIPFSGLLMGGYRAIVWGLIYAPTSPQMVMILVPHSLTLVLEGQAYILAMLAVVLQGRAFLQPRSVGATSHRQGYWQGLKLTWQLYLLIVLMLAAAAIYEVLEAVLLLTFLA